MQSEWWKLTLGPIINKSQKLPYAPGFAHIEIA